MINEVLNLGEGRSSIINSARFEKSSREILGSSIRENMEYVFVNLVSII